MVEWDKGCMAPMLLLTGLLYTTGAEANVASSISLSQHCLGTAKVLHVQCQLVNVVVGCTQRSHSWGQS